MDYKQDRSLSASRLVCKDASLVLRRKDSSGTILRDGAARRSSDFDRAFVTEEQTVIQPGDEMISDFPMQICFIVNISF